MINIVLKNKKIIKFYKYSLNSFKFLNKHLYILSILSFISKSRKSIYYKIISYTIKLVIILNLVISSGLFYAAMDLQTPLTAIYSFYDTILSPYKDLLLEKYQNLMNLNVEDKVSNNFVNKKESKLLPSVEVENTDKPNNSLGIKDYIAFLALLFFVYFIFGVPGPSVDPRSIDNYNFITKSLINTKLMLNDIWNIIKIYWNGDGAKKTALFILYSSLT
jgi:hypothetical protein